MNEPQSVSGRVFQLRKNSGRSRRHVAKLINLNEHTYIKRERGDTHFRDFELVRLSKLLKVNIHWLLTGEGDKEPPNDERD